MTTETLTFGLELKGGLESREFEGHGSVFGNVDLDGDIIVPGAFKNSLARHKAEGTLPQMFWMHRMDMVPGKWLEMREDDRGLYVKGVLAKTQLGDEMRTLMKMEAVRGLSIGFWTLKADWDDQGNRLIKETDLVETSIVSLAANPLAEVESAKARLSANGEFVPRPRDFEQTLRDAGYTRRVAKRITAKVFSKVDATSPDEDEALALLSKALQRPWMERPISTLFE